MVIDAPLKVNLNSPLNNGDNVVRKQKTIIKCSIKNRLKNVFTEFQNTIANKKILNKFLQQRFLLFSIALVTHPILTQIINVHSNQQLRRV